LEGVVGIFARIFGSRNVTGSSGDSQGIHFYVQCAKCGEKIHIRASRTTDVYQEYPEGSERGTPTLHKEILGANCPNLMYIHVTFDAAFNVVEAKADRCSIISKEQYEAPVG
jgi:hypothetical protein